MNLDCYFITDKDELLGPFKLKAMTVVSRKSIQDEIKVKSVKVKPAFYALCYYELKLIAQSCGYNLVLHGSLNRDMDLIAIPWTETVTSANSMIMLLNDYLGGDVMKMSHKQRFCFPHGRMSYVINLNRGEFTDSDPQYYLDISVIPTHSGIDKNYNCEDGTR